MDSSLTRPSGLFKLPAELLYSIFDDVYINWSEGEPSTSSSSRPPTSPLCRALVDFQRQGLYRNTFIDVRQSLIRFFKSIVAEPRLACRVVSLTLQIPINSAGRSSSRAVWSRTGEISAEEITSCFSSFRNLEQLSLEDHTTVHFPSLLSVLTSDLLSPKCTSISLSIPRHHQDALANLPLNLKTFGLEIFEWQSSAIGETEDTVSRPPFSQLSNLSLSKFPRGDYHNTKKRDFLLRCTSLRRLTLHHFCHNVSYLHDLPSLGSIEQLSLLGKPPLGESITLVRLLPYFSDLRQLTLAMDSSKYRYGTGFLDVISRLPLEILIFESPEQPSLSILEALISPPNQHPTLRKLQLDCVDRVGTIGTRLSTIAIHFNSIKPGTKVAIDDFFPEDWDVPRVPPEYSIEELKALQLAGTNNGVQVDGNVFEALEVREAYEEDVDLLKKRWENWKTQARRARGIKGKQTRR